MRRFCLLLVVLPVFIACGGVEGHYTLDRELTTAGMERFADRELTKTFTQMYGENAKVPEDVREKAKEEMRVFLAQLDMDIHLKPEGTFSSSARMEKETEDAEGSWKLNGDQLEITTTRKNGKNLESPKTEALHYRDGRLSYDDPEAQHPFLVLSRQ
jgi:hypothetical protein